MYPCLPTCSQSSVFTVRIFGQLVFQPKYSTDDIIAEFGIYGLKLGDLEPTSLSLSKVFQLSQENTNVIRSFLYMMAAHPQGFVRMLKYGENDDW